jgi:hypothetical protein
MKKGGAQFTNKSTSECNILKQKLSASERTKITFKNGSKCVITIDDKEKVLIQKIKKIFDRISKIKKKS